MKVHAEVRARDNHYTQHTEGAALPPYAEHGLKVYLSCLLLTAVSTYSRAQAHPTCTLADASSREGKARAPSGQTGQEQQWQRVPGGRGGESPANVGNPCAAANRTVSSYMTVLALASDRNRPALAVRLALPQLNRQQPLLHSSCGLLQLEYREIPGRGPGCGR